MYIHVQYHFTTFILLETDEPLPLMARLHYFRFIETIIEMKLNINIKYLSFTFLKQVSSEKINHTECTDHNCLANCVHRIKLCITTYYINYQ